MEGVCKIMTQPVNTDAKSFTKKLIGMKHLPVRKILTDGKLKYNDNKNDLGNEKPRRKMY